MILIATVMTACLFAAAQATAEREVYIAGNKISDGYYEIDNTGASSSLNIAPDTDNYNIHYDVDNGTLTLKNATINTPEDEDDEFSGIAVLGGPLTIHLIGSNTVHRAVYALSLAGYSNAIYANDSSPLTITASDGATLLTEASGGMSGNYGIGANNGLTIRGGEIEAKANSGQNNPYNVDVVGIYVKNGAFRIYNGTIRATATSDKAECVAGFFGNDAVFHISGGTFTARGDNQSKTHPAYGIFTNGNVIISDTGAVSATAINNNNAGYGVWFNATVDLTLTDNAVLTSTGTTSATGVTGGGIPSVNCNYRNAYTVYQSDNTSGTNPTTKSEYDYSVKDKYLNIVPGATYTLYYVNGALRTGSNANDPVYKENDPSWSVEKDVLTLNDFLFTTSAETALSVENNAKLNVKGTNVIKSTRKDTEANSRGIDGITLTISGTGTLDVRASNVTTSSVGIDAAQSLTVTKGVTVNATAGDVNDGIDASSYGIRVSTLNVEDSANVNAAGGRATKSAGVCSSGDVRMDNASATFISDAVNGGSGSSAAVSSSAFRFTNCAVTASTNKNGSSNVPYDSAKHSDYKYIKVIPAKAPTISPDDSKTYAPGQEITISCDEKDAAIYYTTDGTDPTTSSEDYTKPIAVDANTTINAIAIKPNYTYSSNKVATANYSIAPETPTFDPPAGTYPNAQKVTITCATLGAAIYYTTDGNEPGKATTGSSLYVEPIDVSSSVTLKAKAFKDGLTDSETASAGYYIVPPVSTYTITYLPGQYGSGDARTQIKTEGTTLTLLGETFEREGYLQIGWATSDGGSLAYKLAGTYAQDANATLYPVWEVEVCSLRVLKGAGNGDYPVGKAVTVKADEAPLGQRFVKWRVVMGEGAFADSNAPETTFTVKRDSIIEAMFDIIPVPLTGINIPDSCTLTVGESVTLAAQ